MGAACQRMPSVTWWPSSRSNREYTLVRTLVSPTESLRLQRLLFHPETGGNVQRYAPIERHDEEFRKVRGEA